MQIFFSLFNPNWCFPRRLADTPFYQKWNSDIVRRVLRYGLVRGCGILIYFVCSVFFVEVFSLNPVLSTGLAFLLTSGAIYVFSYGWVFLSSALHSEAIPKFIVITVLDFVLNTGIMFLTVNVWGWWYIWGQVGAATIIPPINFLLNFYWAFK